MLRFLGSSLLQVVQFIFIPMTSKRWFWLHLHWLSLDNFVGIWIWQVAKEHVLHKIRTLQDQVGLNPVGNSWVFFCEVHDVCVRVCTCHFKCQAFWQVARLLAHTAHIKHSTSLSSWLNSSILTQLSLATEDDTKLWFTTRIDKIAWKMMDQYTKTILPCVARWFSNMLMTLVKNR